MLTASDSYAACREAVTFQRLPHVAVVRLDGPEAGPQLDAVLAGPVGKLVENRVLWTALLDDAGRVVTDVLVHNDFDSFLLTFDDGATADVLASLTGHTPGTEVTEVSSDTAVFSIEGPSAAGLPAALFGSNAEGLAPLGFLHCDLDDADVVLVRVGFTGEHAYRLIVPAAQAAALEGRIRQLVPGAPSQSPTTRDLLMLEVGSFNIARDKSAGDSALDLGLHWMIDFRKRSFRGRDAVMAELRTGVGRARVFLTSSVRTVPSPGAEVRHGGRVVGSIVHAAWSPSAAAVVASASVETVHGWAGNEFSVGAATATVVSAPFVRTAGARGSGG